MNRIIEYAEKKIQQMNTLETAIDKVKVEIDEAEDNVQAFASLPYGQSVYKKFLKIHKDTLETLLLIQKEQEG